MFFNLKYFSWFLKNVQNFGRKPVVSSYNQNVLDFRSGFRYNVITTLLQHFLTLLPVVKTLQQCCWDVAATSLRCCSNFVEMLHQRRLYIAAMLLICCSNVVWYVALTLFRSCSNVVDMLQQLCYKMLHMRYTLFRRCSHIV